MKDFARAIEDYSVLVDDNRADVETYIARATAYLNVGEYGKAVADCDEVVRRSPKRADVWSKVFKSPDDRVRAERSIRETIAREAKAAAESPGSGDHRQKQAIAQVNLGHLYKGAGRPREAEEAYGHALEIQQKLASDSPKSLTGRASRGATPSWEAS